MESATYWILPCERDLHGTGAEFARDAVEQIVSLAVLPERSPGDESNAVLLAMLEKVVPFAIGEAVAVLDGDDGNDFAGALEVFEGDVGERDVLDFALRAQVGKALHGRVERHGRVGDMELVDGDAVEAKAF